MVLIGEAGMFSNHLPLRPKLSSCVSDLWLHNKPPPNVMPWNNNWSCPGPLVWLEPFDWLWLNVPRWPHHMPIRTSLSSWCFILKMMSLCGSWYFKRIRRKLQGFSRPGLRCHRTLLPPHSVSVSRSQSNPDSRLRKETSTSSWAEWQSCKGAHVERAKKFMVACLLTVFHHQLISWASHSFSCFCLSPSCRLWLWSGRWTTRQMSGWWRTWTPWMTTWPPSCTSPLTDSWQSFGRMVRMCSCLSSSLTGIFYS